MLDNVVRDLEELGAQVTCDRETRPSPWFDAIFDLSVDDRTAEFVVEEKRRCPYPGELSQLLDRAVLVPGAVPMLVAPGVTATVAERLVGAGWSWADGEGSFTCGPRACACGNGPYSDALTIPPPPPCPGGRAAGVSSAPSSRPRGWRSRFGLEEPASHYGRGGRTRSWRSSALLGSSSLPSVDPRGPTRGPSWTAT